MTAHKKAKLFMQYAEKAQVSETPWEYFEWLDRHGNYRQFCSESDVILVDLGLTVRLKPTTIRIGEYDVPEPLRVMPLYGDWVYLANPFHVKCVQASHFDGDFSAHKLWFEGGLLHATPEAAMLHSKALVSLTARGDV